MKILKVALAVWAVEALATCALLSRKEPAFLFQEGGILLIGLSFVICIVGTALVGLPIVSFMKKRGFRKYCHWFMAGIVGGALAAAVVCFFHMLGDGLRADNVIAPYLTFTCVAWVFSIPTALLYCHMLKQQGPQISLVKH